MNEEKNDSVHAECPKHKGQPEIACVECRVEEKQIDNSYPELKAKKIDVKELREQGFLQEANRQFFHPLGLALMVERQDNGTEVIDGVLDFRNDPEGVYYDLKTSPSERIEKFRTNAENVESERQKHLTTRNELFETDYGIEPIP